MKWLGFGLVVVALVGCGDDALPGCDPDVPCGAGTGTGTGTAGTEDPAATMSGVASTSSADTGTAGMDDTSGSLTVADSTGESDTSGTSDDGTGTDESGSESTGAQGNVVYTAQAVIGALDRIRVFKEDLDADTCIWMVLVSPAIGGQYDVTTPEGWSVESIQASDVGETCGSQSPGMFGAEAATSAEGTVELGALGPSGVYPCEVSVDVTVSFAGGLPGVPPVDVLDASAIPIDGC